MAKEKTTTSFPKMGTSAAQGIRSAQVVKGKSVKKTGNSKGGMLEGATASHRANIQERLGAKLAPSAVLYAPNAAESSLTQRNVYTVPSRAGTGDFYLRKSY